MPKYRVLSFDGGGVRGLITVRLMERLAALPGLENWYKKAALYAGTSTGGLIAMGLAHGLPLARLLDLYQNKSAKIFTDSLLDNLVDLGNWAGAQYSTKFLEQELKDLLTEQLSIGDISPIEGKRVLVTAFDLDQADDTSLKLKPNPPAQPPKHMWKPKIFHNFPGEDRDKAAAYKVGLYTCAAPTFFPSVDGYIDGGVFANNPSMCALAQTQDDRNPEKAELKDVVLFSLGTGERQQYMKNLRYDWGKAQWVEPLISIFMDGIAGIAHFQCQQILSPNRYRRLQPPLEHDVNFPLDAVSPLEIQDMLAFADGVNLDEIADWLKNVWMKN